MSKIRVIESSDSNNIFQEVDIQIDEIPDHDYQNCVLTVNKNITHQVMEGFGASFTDSSAYLVNEILVEKDRKKVMDLLFSHEKGIGVSVLRNTIGSSDYARKIYNYQDQKNSRFDVSYDRESIVPLTYKAKLINPQLKVMASPWSAPGWMKTSGNMIGGTLKKDKQKDYAEYLANYIEEMAKDEIEIEYITVQNEPMFVPEHYPGMYMDAAMQTEFITEYLRPEFKKRDIKTKILGYDHNWDRVEYPLHLIKNDVVDGVAWHWYGGSASAQSQVFEFDPNIPVFFTEGSGGEWIPGFKKGFANLIKTGIDIMNHNSKTLILWNIALNETNGPTVPGFGKSTCRPLIRINEQTKKFEPTIDYYGLGHFSKFVKNGSVRISSNCNKNIDNTSFLTTDNKIVSVIFNNYDEEIRMKYHVGSDSYNLKLKGKSAYTIVIDNGN